MDTRVLPLVLLIRHTAWPLLLAAVLTMAGASIAAAQGAAQPRAELTITFDLAAGTNVLYVQGNALAWHHLSGGFPQNIRILGNDPTRARQHEQRPLRDPDRAHVEELPHGLGQRRELGLGRAVHAPADVHLHAGRNHPRHGGSQVSDVASPSRN